MRQARLSTGGEGLRVMALLEEKELQVTDLKPSFKTTGLPNKSSAARC